MTGFVASYPTARKKHRCQMCGWSIRIGEPYLRSVAFDVGEVWSTKICLWCARSTERYCRERGETEWEPEGVFEWLEDGFPAVWTQLRAGWTYPDGERVPLPFQPRCHSCGILMDTDQLWCPPCNQERLDRVTRQFDAPLGAFRRRDS